MNALFHLLAIWTAVSFAIGLTWIVLCCACDGLRYVRRSMRVRTRAIKTWVAKLAMGAPVPTFEPTGSRLRGGTNGSQ